MRLSMFLLSRYSVRSEKNEGQPLPPLIMLLFFIFFKIQRRFSFYVVGDDLFVER